MEDQLFELFRRVFRRDFPDKNIQVEEVEEWDSLSHIQLIIAIETEFGLMIEPDDIPPLYSNFSLIVEYLRNHFKRG